MPAAIILAAGSSIRLGQPKQLIRMANETLLERSIRIAHLADLAPIFVVVSSVLAEHPDPPKNPFIRNLAVNGKDTTTIPFELLINREAAEGMASSIRLGIQASTHAATCGAVILACDQIAVTPEHLRRLTLIATAPRASTYAGRNGIPAYFPASSFGDLLRLTGNIGARDLLRHAASLPLLNGDLDIDSPADLARARILFPDIAS